MLGIAGVMIAMALAAEPDAELGDPATLAAPEPIPAAEVSAPQRDRAAEQLRLGFHVDFPGEAKQEALEQKLQQSWGVANITLNIFTLESEGIIFQVVHTVLPYKSLTIGNKAAALEGMVRGYATKHGAQITTRRSLKLDGAPGIDFEGIIPAAGEQDPEQAFRFRAFSHGSALVGVVTVGYLSQGDNDERSRRFLESLRLLEPARPLRRNR
jgi:hypothetical protein